MRGYRWVCHVCETGNDPELSNCSKCRFPAEATGIEIQAAKKVSKPIKKDVVGRMPAFVLILGLTAPLLIFLNSIETLTSTPSKMKYVAGVISESVKYSRGSIFFSLRESSQVFVYENSYPNQFLARDYIKAGNYAHIGYFNLGRNTIRELSVDNMVIITPNTAHNAILADARVSLWLSVFMFGLIVFLYIRQLPNPSSTGR